jgi:hypothetical protein
MYHIAYTEGRRNPLICQMWQHQYDLLAIEHWQDYGAACMWTRHGRKRLIQVIKRGMRPYQGGRYKHV